MGWNLHLQHYNNQYMAASAGALPRAGWLTGLSVVQAAGGQPSSRLSLQGLICSGVGISQRCNVNCYVIGVKPRRSSAREACPDLRGGSALTRPEPPVPAILFQYREH